MALPDCTAQCPWLQQVGREQLQMQVHKPQLCGLYGCQWE